ncbi:hypothetical protein E4U41_003281 [Claviceps citrina]|nr:hypothetical protein E4U41_003281 [Claviceps citrina]
MKAARLLALLPATRLVTAKPTVFLIRHGEKPGGGDVGLSPEGQQRAQCLRTVFGRASNHHVGHVLAQAYKPGMHVPRGDLLYQREEVFKRPLVSNSGLTSDFADRTGADGKRKRAFDTVKPLADDLGLEVDVSCDREDAECVRKVVEGYGGAGNILICWEHGMLSAIAEALGGSNVPKYPGDRFDDIWIDPYPYSAIVDIVSERCPGLDVVPLV